MSLPIVNEMHYIGCHTNEPCLCSVEIECIHEECICDELLAAYRIGREDAAKAVEAVLFRDDGFTYPTNGDLIAAARGDGA